MLSREDIIHKLQEQAEFLKAEYGVRSIGLFGSTRFDNRTPESDIDLVVEFSAPIGLRFIELAEYLEGVLGAPVDLLTPEGIAGIRNPEIAASIRDSIEYV